jgi:hypothetical protein
VRAAVLVAVIAFLAAQAACASRTRSVTVLYAGPRRDEQRACAQACATRAKAEERYQCLGRCQGAILTERSCQISDQTLGACLALATDGGPPNPPVVAIVTGGLQSVAGFGVGASVQVGFGDGATYVTIGGLLVAGQERLESGHDGGMAHGVAGQVGVRSVPDRVEEGGVTAGVAVGMGYLDKGDGLEHTWFYLWPHARANVGYLWGADLRVGVEVAILASYLILTDEGPVLEPDEDESGWQPALEVSGIFLW